MSQARDIIDEYPQSSVLSSSHQTTVYRSEDPNTGVDVVVKLLTALGNEENLIIRKHFLRAMGAVQFLRLPAFPGLIDFGFTQDNSAFMVMEWVDGFDIGNLAGFPPQRTVPMLAQVVDALEALAMGDVYHHNISPSNILVAEKDGGEMAKIIGFGTAVYLSGVTSGSMIGHSPDSDRFTAPERLQPPEEPVGGTISDIYSLALTSVDVLGGHVQRLGSEKPSVSFPEAVRARIGSTNELESILAGAIRFDPEQRTTTYPLLKHALQEAAAAAASNEPAAAADLDDEEDNLRTQRVDPDILPPEEDEADESGDVHTDKTVILPIPSPAMLEAEEAAAAEQETPSPPPIPEPPPLPEPPAVVDEGGGSAGDSPEVPISEAPTMVDVPLPGYPPAQPTGDEDIDIDAAPTAPNASLPEPPPADSEEHDELGVGDMPTAVDVPLPKPPPLIPDDDGMPDPDEVEETAQPEWTPPKVFDPNKTDPAVDPDSMAPPPLPTPKATAPPKKAADKKTGGGGLPIVLGVAGVVLTIAVVVLALWWVRGRSEPPPPPPTPVVVQATPVPPTPAPVEPDESVIHTALAEADQFLLNGDLEAAKAVVATISEEELAGFSDEELEIHQGIIAAVQGSQLEAAVSDLEGGLAHGSIRMIKRGIAGLERIDEAEWADQPGLRTKLEDARNAIRLHTLLWRAHDAGDHAQVLERAQAMIAALPKYSTPYNFRKDSAAVLESESDRLTASAEYSQALERLAPIQAYWRDREGLTDRITRIEAAQKKYTSQAELIAAAVARGEAGEPEGGLAELAKMTPMPVHSKRYDDAKAQLQTKLAETDAGTPTLELAPDQALAYKKKRPVVLAFVITDDYRVVNTSAHIRVGAATDFAEMVLSAGNTADRYVLTIPPEVHQNEDFVLYVEARDLSGHIGSLGSPEQPLVVNRKKGLKALFSR